MFTLCVYIVWLHVYFMAMKTTNHIAAEQHPYSEDMTREYCSKESFQASCLKNEVIVMTSAIYGRMKMGRCLDSEDRQIYGTLGKDPKFLGCSENVMYLMNMKCSGESQCEVRVMFDKDFEGLKPCYDALQLYLEASYDCVSIIESDRTCQVAASSNPLHIVLSSTPNLVCGTKTQPWVIEAPTGQQINVSLLDFGSNIKEPITNQWQSCQQYGYIIDKTAKKNVSICRPGQIGQSVVYKSYSNSIEVVTNVRNTDSNDDSDKQSRILIGFYAIGCSNIVPPEDTWLRRKDNEATIGCYSSHQTWHLRCTENQWIGVIGNCSRDASELNSPSYEMKSSSNFHQVTIIVGVAVIALIISVTIICCGAVCLKRHYAMNTRQHFHLIEENYKKFNGMTSEDHKKPIPEHNNLL